MVAERRSPCMLIITAIKEKNLCQIVSADTQIEIKIVKAYRPCERIEK